MCFKKSINVIKPLSYKTCSLSLSLPPREQFLQERHFFLNLLRPHLSSAYGIAVHETEKNWEKFKVIDEEVLNLFFFLKRHYFFNIFVWSKLNSIFPCLCFIVCFFWSMHLSFVSFEVCIFLRCSEVRNQNSNRKDLLEFIKIKSKLVKRICQVKALCVLTSEKDSPKIKSSKSLVITCL